MLNLPRNGSCRCGVRTCPYSYTTSSADSATSGGLPCTAQNLIMCSCLSDFCVDTGLEQEQYIIVGEGGHMSKISGTGA